MAVLSIFALVDAVSLVPARRAAAIEPMQALRNE
jgi:ABC-type lipoprotein release transport system permease subunit